MGVEPRAIGLFFAGLVACGDPVAQSGAPSRTAPAPPATEQFVFRQVLVGALRVPPRRLTWTLAEVAGKARLSLDCQMGKRVPVTGLSLNGQERDESLWQAPSRVVYQGVWERAGSGQSARLSAVEAPAGAPGCDPLPGAIGLRCSPTTIDVLPAGAVLVPGVKMDDDRMTPPHWEPSATERRDGLACALGLEGDARPFRAIATDLPLVLIPAGGGAAGVEWVHEHSDQVVQTGAYRFLAAQGAVIP